MSAINKLDFLNKYGTDKHRAGIPAKVSHLVGNLPERKDHFGDERDEIARSSLVKGEHLDRMVHHPDQDIRQEATHNPNLQPHHIDHILKNGSNREVQKLVDSHNPNAKKLTAEHLHAAIDRPMGEKRGAGDHPAWLMGYRKDLNDSHWNKIATHPSSTVTYNAIHSDNMPMKHLLTTAIDHPDMSVRITARDKRRENIQKGIKDE